MSNQTTMKYSGNTGELVCYVAGDEALRLVEPDFERANSISKAIQAAFLKGQRLGRLNLQLSLERHMDELNKA